MHHDHGYISLFNIVGNIWDTESTQIEIYNKGLDVFKHFNAQMLHIIL